MFNGANPLIFELAKQLRNRMTQAESVLWHHLRNEISEYKFRRQHPFGIFIADFYCHKAKLIIEVDGSVHNDEMVKQHDKERQEMIEESGIKLIRFSNEEVLNDIEKVLTVIRSKLSDT